MAEPQIWLTQASSSIVTVQKMSLEWASRFHLASLAPTVERIPEKDRGPGSNPGRSICWMWSRLNPARKALVATVE